MDTRRPGRVAYTVDASVTTAWVLAEESSDAAIRLRDDSGRGNVTLYSTRHTIYESLNAVWKTVNKGLLDRDRGLLACTSLSMYSLQEVELYPEDLEKAMEIAVDERLAFYDAAYIAVAVKTDSILITADMRQLTASRKYVDSLHISEY